MLDLFSSPDAEPLNRSKVMTVGNQNVGKTSLLNCLFPISGIFTVVEPHILSKGRKENRLELQGPLLMRFEKDREDKVLEKIFLTEKDSKVEEIFDREKKSEYGIKLTFTVSSKKKSLEFFTKDANEKETWLSRLKQLCMNEATHGIVIRNHQIRGRSFANSQKGEVVVDLSVWDFAGQRSYYNHHHFFISLRTIFLVLWRLDEEENSALDGLRFWLKSLYAHLGEPEDKSKNSYTIIVLGTFLDHPSVSSKAKGERGKKVLEVMNEVGLNAGFHYHEVSCVTMENIENVKDAIYHSVLSHPYIGERVPKTYLIVEEAVRELLQKNKEFPVVEVDDLVTHCRPRLPLQAETVKRALSLLSLWGECVYFEEPEELSKIVVLDPNFLTQGILADLFLPDPNVAARRKDGIIRHSELVHIWARFSHREDFKTKAPQFVSLLEKFGVLFPVHGSGEEDFMKKWSIVPSLLPEKPEGIELNTFRTLWPDDPPFTRQIEMEKVFKFNILPDELVSRLLVLLHPYIQENLVWKDQVVIFRREENTQGWIRVEAKLRRLIITLRGTDFGSCNFLLTWIVDRVSEVKRKHKNVCWQEVFRSPHFPSGELSLQEVRNDDARKEEEKSLVCPETLLPINAQRLLLRSGEVESLQQRGKFLLFLVLVLVLRLIYAM